MADDLVGKYLLGVGSRTSPAKPGLVEQFLLPKPSETEPVKPVSDSGIPYPTPENMRQQTQYVEPSIASKAASVATALPVEWGTKTGKHFVSGVETASEGVSNINANRPASGVGKIGLGLLSAAVSPLTGAISTIGSNVDKAIGKPNSTLPTDIKGNILSNKEIEFPSTGERVEAVLGSGLPIMKGSKAVAATLPSNRAISTLVDAIGTENLPTVINRLKENPRLSIADVVPAVKRMGQKLITTEGPHINKFEKFVNDRITSRKGSVEAAYDDTMGVPVNIVNKLKELKQSARDVGNKEIQPAIKGTPFVDISPVVASIDAKLKPGINSVISAGDPLPLGDIEKPLIAIRKFISDDKSLRTDPNQLHQFQSALRAKADDLLNSTDGQNRQLGRALMDVRNQIVNAIDAASPRVKNDKGEIVGAYKQSLSKYRDEMQIQDAFNKGQLVTRNRLGQLEDHPEYWKEWLGGATDEMKAAAKEGARLAVHQQINAARHAGRKGEDIGQIEFNKQKLEALFGKDEIKELSNRLRDETAIAETNSDYVKGSQTAMRMKADKSVDLPQPKSLREYATVAALGEIAAISQGAYPGTASATLAATDFAKRHLYDRAVIKLAKKKNEKLTDLLTATGDDRAELIKILESHIPQPKQSILQKASNLPIISP